MKVKFGKGFLLKVSLIIVVTIVLLTTLGLDANGAENNYRVLRLLSLVSFVIFVVTNRQRLYSPYSLVILLLYVFNCGQLWLELLGINFSMSSYLITRFNALTLSKGIGYCLICINLIDIGGSVFTQNEELTHREYSVKLCDDSYWETTGRILFIFSLPFVMLYDYNLLKAAVAGGYGAALTARTQSAILTFGVAVFTFSIFTVLYCERRTKLRRIILCTAVVRFVLLMLSTGSRMTSIVFLCILIILSVKKRKADINLKSFGVVLLTYLLIVTISYIAEYRGSFSLTTFLMYFTEKNLLTKQIQEFGSTFLDIPILMENIDKVGYACGLTYIYGTLSMIPKISVVIPDIQKYAGFSAILNNYFTVYSNSGLGGSLLAELYYNFGWLAIFIMPLIGKVLNKLSCSVDSTNESNITRTVSGYILFTMCLYVRGNLGEIIPYLRAITYIMILTCLFRNTSKHRIAINREN